MHALCNMQLFHHLPRSALLQTQTDLAWSVYTLFLLSSPHGWDLIFHLICAQPLVDGVHYFVTLVTASSSIKASNDGFLCAAEVGGPLQPEFIVHILTRWTCIPSIHNTWPISLIFLKTLCTCLIVRFTNCIYLCLDGFDTCSMPPCSFMWAGDQRSRLN